MTVADPRANPRPITDVEPGVQRHLSLRDGVGLVADAPGGAVLTSWPRSRRVAPAGLEQASVLAVLRALARPVTASQLTTLPGTTAAAVDGLLTDLRDGGWLRTELRRADGTVLATADPRWPRGPVEAPLHPPRLSRLAALARDGDDLVLDSPLALAALRLHDPAWVATTVTPDPEDPRPEAAALRTLLADSGLLAAAADDEDFGRAQWSPHELACHHHSRLRDDLRIGVDFGGSYWARDRFAELPTRHPTWRGPLQPLARWRPGPDGGDDPRLSVAVSTRRSRRHYDDDRPLDAATLGAFLDRTLAAVRRPDGSSGRHYPAGGAQYELEAYVAVRLVSGVEPGLHHYDPEEHGLRRVPATRAAAEALLATSAAGLAEGGTPQALLVLSTRYGRLAWKYRAIAYSLTLKHVGVLVESFSLTAAAMDLAGCAVGTGDSDAFALATGLDYRLETSVGEFALGSAAPDAEPVA